MYPPYENIIYLDKFIVNISNINTTKSRGTDPLLYFVMLSLDSDDDTNSSGWEPADDANTENSVLSLMMIDDLINKVSIKYPEAKAIFSLLMEDSQISSALKQVDLKKGKSQAYEYVKKMQSYAQKSSTIRIIVNDV